MSSEAPPPSVLDPAKAALYDKNLREWPAPAGVRAEPEGLAASFQALGMRCVSDRDGEAIRFEAWKTPRTAGAILAAVLASAVYLGMDHAGFRTFPILVAVVIVAFYAPLAILPSWRVSGRIDAGKLALRVEARGLLARKSRMEAALRFYLAAPGP